MGITYMEMAYPKPLERAAEWRKMAEKFGIEIEEDPDLMRQRRKQVQSDLEAMFGPVT